MRGRRPKHPRWKVALAGRPEHVQSRAREAPHQVHDRVVESSIKTEGEELHAQERRQIDARCGASAVARYDRSWL